jgi:hypothetical protein
MFTWYHTAFLLFAMNMALECNSVYFILIILLAFCKYINALLIYKSYINLNFQISYKLFIFDHSWFSSTRCRYHCVYLLLLLLHHFWVLLPGVDTIVSTYCCYYYISLLGSSTRCRYHWVVLLLLLLHHCWVLLLGVDTTVSTYYCYYYITAGFFY